MKWSIDMYQEVLVFTTYVAVELNTFESLDFVFVCDTLAKPLSQKLHR